MENRKQHKCASKKNLSLICFCLVKFCLKSHLGKKSAQVAMFLTSTDRIPLVKQRQTKTTLVTTMKGQKTRGNQSKIQQKTGKGAARPQGLLFWAKTYFKTYEGVSPVKNGAVPLPHYFCGGQNL